MAANGKDLSTSNPTTKDRNYMEVSVHNGDHNGVVRILIHYHYTEQFFFHLECRECRVCTHQNFHSKASLDVYRTTSSQPTCKLSIQF